MNNKIKVSVVSYTNSLPFLYGIENTNLLNHIDLMKDYPSECARKLKNNQADVGIVPVGSLVDHAEYHIISNYCIGAKDAVDSVFIFSDKPIEEVETIRLDEQSRTSNGLARILVQKFWKKEVKWVENGPSDAFVEIGDRTFGKKKIFPYYYDLSTYWNKLTGLPFVFAVWASTKKLSDDFVEMFDKSIEYGVRNIDTVLPSIPKVDGFDVEFYLKNSLDYVLDEPKKEAMQLYLKWLKQLDAL